MSKKKELTALQQSQIKTAQKIIEYKTPVEANIVSILYKIPDRFHDIDLKPNAFHAEEWKTYFSIAYGLFVNEHKNVLDEITVSAYVEKHPQYKDVYLDNDGYKSIRDAMEYISEDNLDAYIAELKKWNTVIQLVKKGYPVCDRLEDYIDMSLNDIYDEFETFLNHTFINADYNVQTFNVFDGMYEFIDELNEDGNIGIPFYNSSLLTNEVGGFNYQGNIYGLGAGSGTGKSTMAFNYLVPSLIETNEKAVFIINEEDEKKFKKELLIWVANNIFNADLHKYTLRNGKFSPDVLNLLRECAAWIEDKKEKRILTVIPLQHYSVEIAIKIINKYSSLGVKIFVLDTLKESCNASTDEIYKSMMRDMVKLYDTVKPSSKNVGLLVTYQLGKSSLKVRHLTNNEIGQAKSIVDVMSVNIMMRRPFDDEYEGGNHELRCWRVEGKEGKTKIEYKLKPENNPMITFITKNRFGATDARQIVSECDLSTNVYRDTAYCHVPQDF